MEHHEQIATVQWFRHQYRNANGCLFAIPNGAILCDLPPRQRLLRMNYLIAEGFKKGVSDLFLAYPVGGYAGYWLEMKDVKKTVSAVSPEQLDHLELMRKMGYAADWVSGFDQAKPALNAYMKGQYKPITDLSRNNSRK